MLITLVQLSSNLFCVPNHTIENQLSQKNYCVTVLAWVSVSDNPFGGPKVPWWPLETCRWPKSNFFNVREYHVTRITIYVMSFPS